MGKKFGASTGDLGTIWQVVTAEKSLKIIERCGLGRGGNETEFTLKIFPKNAGQRSINSQNQQKRLDGHRMAPGVSGAND